MNRNGLVTCTGALVLLVLPAAPWAPGARACQKPPDQVECHLVALRAVVKQGDPFQLDFTLINKPMGGMFSPPQGEIAEENRKSSLESRVQEGVERAAARMESPAVTPERE